MALLPDSWSALYAAQLARYQTAFDSDHNMDAKGGVVLAAILAVAIFVLNKELFLVDNKILFAMVILGCCVYGVALGILIIALKPHLYMLPANSSQQQPNYLTKSDEDLMYQLVVDTELATDEITSKLKRKSILFTVATILFVVGTILLIVVKLIAV
jgi:hypothetical protein